MRVSLSIFLLSAALCSSVCSATLVNVWLCSAYPGTDYFSISWGGVNSTRIFYESCAFVTVDNTITSGQAWLWTTNTATTPNQTVALTVQGSWCVDGNRNIIFAYEVSAGVLGIAYPQQDGGTKQNCNTLPSGNALRYFFNAACTVANLNTVDVVLNGVVLKSSLACVSGSVPYVVTIEATSAFFTGTATVALNTPGTNTSVAGPFSLPGVTSPGVDQTNILVVSGDANFGVVPWSFTTDSAVPPTPSGADKLAVPGVFMLAVMAVAGFFAKMQ